MGSLILCHKKKAKQPYHIARIQVAIHTLEELCYFLCNNIYMIDETIMEERLCDWLDEELELEQLAKSLRTLIQQQPTVEQFLMCVLTHAAIYNAAEMANVQQVLEKLQQQSTVEKQKMKADNLLGNGAIKQAIEVYRSILMAPKDETVTREFYGQVYANLGAAYGRLFLYREAAKMYEKAFAVCEKTYMLQAFLYASRCYMSAQEYQDLLVKSEVYQKLDNENMRMFRDVKENTSETINKEIIEQWKEQYRKLAF